MRKLYRPAAILLLLPAMAFGQNDPAKPKAGSGESPLKTEKQRLGYVIGHEFGTSIAQTLEGLGADIDMDALLRGLDDALRKRKPLLTEEESQAVRDAFIRKRREEQEKARKALAEKHLKEGEAFLAENAKKEGVIQSKSGLQYKVLQEGTGPRPKATDRVTVHYKGTLIDGTVFDSSYDRGEPVTFPLDRVIKGWTEGLQLMKVGSKYRFFIPAKLAYGETGAGNVIPPNSVLIFDVELKAIVPSDATPKKKAPR